MQTGTLISLGQFNVLHHSERGFDHLFSIISYLHVAWFVDTIRARLIRKHSSARISFELSGNTN